MDDLLKEAIADAKAVRETALENAKIALEEAFTPRLQSMLSKKIQSEIEVEEGEHEDDEDVDERMHDEDEDDMDEKMRLKADDEDPTDDASEGAHEDDEDVEERMHGEEDDDEVEERMHDEDEDDEKKDEAMHDEDEDNDMDEELDLEAVLKELETEAMHDEDEDDVEERMKDEDEDDKVDENDVSSGIGKADNAHDKKSGDTTGIGNADKAKHTESIDESDEDLNLDEVLAALTEDDEEVETEEIDEVSKLQSELAEHRDVVKYLRGKLNEVNLLNAKLLFTNKLFRAYGLSNDQKMKVVETFDRATNLREVKLVYSTLAESFGTKVKKEIKESKGSASKVVASTKSEKQEVIAEGSELRDRFKKLAGII